MNFTREPIIETVITPKDGYKLIVRNSNSNNQEEYSVDAVEVVSFGKSFFFRSLEKPKAFLLPVGEYEIFETREICAVLKKPQIEKSIKIGGGKVEPSKPKEKPVVREVVATEPEAEIKEESKKRKRIRKRHQNEDKERKELQTEKVATGEAVQKAPPFLTPRGTLLPPPKSLISEQIGRYKDFLTSEAVLPKKKEGELKIEPLDSKPKDENELLLFPLAEDVESQIPSMDDESLFSEKKEEEFSFFEDKEEEEEKIIKFSKEEAASTKESDKNI